MAEGKKSKEQQILEEAAERLRVYLLDKDNTPVFRGEEDILINVVLGKYKTSDSTSAAAQN